MNLIQMTINTVYYLQSLESRNLVTTTPFCSVTKPCPTFVIPWTAAYQAPLSFTISQSLLKCMSTELVVPSRQAWFGSPLYAELCCTFTFPHAGVPLWVPGEGGQHLSRPPGYLGCLYVPSHHQGRKGTPT